MPDKLPQQVSYRKTVQKAQVILRIIFIVLKVIKAFLELF